MSDLYRIFLTPVLITWGIFVLLLICARVKGLSFTRKEKRSFLIVFFIIVSVSGCFVFFKDWDFVFDCRRETQRCDYYHSTVFKRELRFVRSYDLNGITDVEIVSRRRRCGRSCSKTVYRLLFKGGADSFEMPKDFNYVEDARERAAKASAFVQTGKAAYTYKDIMPDGSEKGLMFFMVAAMSMFFASVGIFTLLAKLFGKK